MKTLALAGAYTAIVTPFTTSGAIDLPALTRLLKYQIDGDINGIVVCGSTGEAATLSEKEYSLVVRHTVKTVRGRVPVVAGAGSNNTQRAIEWSRLAAKEGADALLHVTPFYNKPTPNGLVAHYKSIARAVRLPIIMYNVPGRTAQNVPPAIVARIAREVPRVVGIKEAAGNINQFGELLQLVPKHFAVLSGDDSTTLPAMALGARGCISVVANEVPKDFSMLCEAALRDDWDTAREIHFRILPLMNINFIESNPVPVKAALSMMGLMKETVRLPLTPLEKKNRPLLKKCLQTLSLLRHGTH